MPVEQRALWELLLSPAGRETWLGAGTSLEPEPGTNYETDAGTTGEVRTVKEGERLRMTWQPDDRESPTTLQVTLSCPRNDSSKTTLRVHHEKLASQEERAQMRAHWRSVLEAVEDLVSNEST